MDKVHLTLTELCSSYSLSSDLTVFNHIIVPTEFLLSHLEIRLSEYVAQSWRGRGGVLIKLVLIRCVTRREGA